MNKKSPLTRQHRRNNTKKERAVTHSEVMTKPNQITAMIHFLGTKNKTTVGTAMSVASPWQSGEGGENSCIAELGPTEHPPPSHTPCIINGLPYLHRSPNPLLFSGLFPPEPFLLPLLGLSTNG